MNREILYKVIDRYGKDHQIDIAIEEMSELTKALLKDRRYHTEQTKRDVAEEMADVFICLEQLTIMYQNMCSVEQVEKEKLSRLERRMNDDR
jgi:NTP pyrophosphatase (non-canonical NTP hydrolase)